VRIALVDDKWISNKAGSAKGRPSPLGQKFFDALRNATIGNESNKMLNCPAASFTNWQSECVKRGLIDPAARQDSARALLSKYRRELIAANWIACNDTMAWIVP
jgi:hypothetical protein